MMVDQKRVRPATFPLRLSPSIREQVKNFAQQDHVAVNKFIEIAIAEKLSRMEHDAWISETYSSGGSEALTRAKLSSADARTVPSNAYREVCGE